ncbi:MAG: hypothetical protein M3Z37_07550 [Candidatus Eremiobacteraeota bacterium]|nr:hypothetical protein [Candidatus Eremiobacteraeota bacterium]
MRDRTVSAPGSSIKRNLLLAALAQALCVWLLASPAAAIGPVSGPAGLLPSRVFSSPANSDALRFSVPAEHAGAVSAAVFGLNDLSQLDDRQSVPKTALFGQLLDSSYVPDAAQRQQPDPSALVGVHFRLFGGQGGVTFGQMTHGFMQQALPTNAGSGPALFAFYNFAQLAQFPENANALNPPHDVPLPNTAAPAIATLNFGSLNAAQPHTDLLNVVAPQSQAASVEFRFPLVFAGVKANLRMQGASLRSVQPDSLATQILGPALAAAGLRYNAFGGGMTVALPLFDRKATVSLDGLYESLKHNDKALLGTPNSSPLVTAAGFTPYGLQNGSALTSLSAPSTLIFYPNYTDVQRISSAASLAVPIGKRLTVNGGYGVQHYNGEALNTLTRDLNLGTRSFSGGLVYNIPKTNSSIDLIFNRYQYFDEVVPAANRTENRQNIYFSVKF